MILLALAVLTATPATSVNLPGKVTQGPTARVLAADPASFASVIAGAKSGDTVRLVAGRYPAITLRSRTFDPPLVVDASAATSAGVLIYGSTGIRWTGGTIDGSGNPKPNDFGFAAYGSRNITVTGVHFNSFVAGVVFDRVTGGEVSGNWLAHMWSDGIDLAVSRSIVVAHNACSDFQVANGAHPDCIQAWSRYGEPPTADITVTGNSAIGTMQGISLFDGIKDGVPMGGFDRVKISGNTVLITEANGVTAMNCRSCVVRDNKVNSLPNYTYRAQLNVSGSVVNCGNEVTMVPRQSTPACKD